MGSDGGTIRPATPDDVEALRGIEVAAGEPFRLVGMDAVADDDPPEREELAADCTGGRVWVVEVDGELAGYARAGEADGEAYLEQVSVKPRFARRGLGRRLIAAVADWAGQEGYRTLSLTTFTDVAWNAPCYRRLGFHDLDPAELGPELRAIRAKEAASGLDAWPRTAMRRDLRSTR